MLGFRVHSMRLDADVRASLDRAQQASMTRAGMDPEITFDRTSISTASAAAPWAWLALALLPPLVAIWSFPWFVTQDGPAHVYNAVILRTSLNGATSPYQEAYDVHWEPLPNWAGHLALMALLSVLDPRDADRAMMTLTLIGLAASTLWLRLRVRGPDEPALGAFWSSLVAMNLTWLLGFYSFLLGSCLFALTLGLWWDRRDRLNAASALGLSGLLALGYSCHPISLGLTVIALGVLSLATPGPRPLARIGWTVASGLVLVPLGLVYLHFMKAGGAIEPVWETLKTPFSLANWAKQISWVDPITVATKSAFPLIPARSKLFGLMAPAALAALGLLAIYASRVFRGAEPRSGGLSSANLKRGWVLLAAGLIVGGVISPDTLGPRHGFYLAQRVVLLGLVCLSPLLAIGNARRFGWLGTALIGLAAAVQGGFLVDYGARSDRLAGGLMRAKPFVGQHARMATIVLDLKGPFRANPLLHVDTMLGVGTGNVVWDNYEAAWYYFPVRVREDRPHPPVLDFEEVSIRDSKQDANQRSQLWTQILTQHAEQIDVLVVWGRNPRIDAITNRWFEPIHDLPDDPLRVLRRRTKPRDVGDRMEEVVHRPENGRK